MANIAIVATGKRSPLVSRLCSPNWHNSTPKFETFVRSTGVSQNRDADSGIHCDVRRHAGDRRRTLFALRPADTGIPVFSIAFIIEMVVAILSTTTSLYLVTSPLPLLRHRR